MAQGTHETTFDVDASQLMRAVMDYEKYPEFVDGMKKVRVERNGNSTQNVVAHYDLSMMGKDMSYSLSLKEEPEDGHLSWTLLKSEFFKVNNGDWLIQPLGPGRCKARYTSEVEFTFPVPGFMLKPIVKGALPKMMDGFYQRAKRLPVKTEPKPELKPEPVEKKVEEIREPINPVPMEEHLEPEVKIEEKTHEKVKERMSANYESSRNHDSFKNSDLNDSGVLSWAKKLMTVGVGTFFLTEEALRNLVTEFKFPKEIMGSVMEGAKSVRKEFMQNVVQEMMGKISDKMDPAAVLAEFLRKNEVTFEIKVKVKDKSDLED